MVAGRVPTIADLPSATTMPLIGSHGEGPCCRDQGGEVSVGQAAMGGIPVGLLGSY